jgi:uncharacterized transporter YbjL
MEKIILAMVAVLTVFLLILAIAILGFGIHSM